MVFAGTDRRPKALRGRCDLSGRAPAPGCPATPNWAGLDVALVGVPMDLGVTNRPGARLGPRAVRAIERIGPYHHVHGIAPFTEVKVADVGDVPFRSRFSLDDSHADIEAFFARMAGGRRCPRERRRRPLDQPADPQGAGRRPAARHGAYRCAWRHQRSLRGRQVPPRRAVPAGGAGRRARPRAHHSDRHPRRRRISVGVLLRQRHDRHPRRRGAEARHRPRHRAVSARSLARGRPTSPSISTASIRPLRRARARPRSAA